MHLYLHSALVGPRHGVGNRSFFSIPDANGKSHSQLPIKIVFAIMYLWCKGLSLKQTRDMLVGLVAQISKEAVIDWRNYIRDVCKSALNDAPPMGGPGEVIQIDESLMRGKRKYNRGRLLLGNQGGGRGRNYGQRVVGPWIFGMVWKHQDGTQEIRLFHVLRRNEATLGRLIQRHIAPGTTIASDEWAAYRNISAWPQFNYTHRTVNHHQHYVDPVTGANTQRIETHWAHIKTQLLRNMHGTSAILLPGHLAEYWWKNLHCRSPFWDLIDMIKVYFPLQ